MVLTRSVDPQVTPAGVLRQRIALCVSFFVGAGLVAAAIRGEPRAAPPRPPPPPAPAVAPHITVPAPIVVHVETTVQAAATPPPSDGIGCPVVTRSDEPIGKPVVPGLLEKADSRATVRAAAAAPVIAVMDGSAVWVSDDDGRSFQRAFEDNPPDHVVDHVDVAADGTVYVDAGLLLGVRARGGRTVWRPIRATCAEGARCVSTIGVLGGELIALVDDQIHVSRDQGRTWKQAPSADTPWDVRDGTLFGFRGALFQVNHYTDMCGVDDYDTYRLDAEHRVAHDVFHNYYTGDGEPVLEPSDDVNTTWTWANKCRVQDNDRAACTRVQPVKRQLLEAAMLAPREGARALAVYGGSLIELCTGGVRQVYRQYPFGHLDAVDASGRALVMNGATLLRWSPVHGWRTLKTFPSPPPSDAGSD